MHRYCVEKPHGAVFRLISFMMAERRLIFVVGEMETTLRDLSTEQVLDEIHLIRDEINALEMRNIDAQVAIALLERTLTAIEKLTNYVSLLEAKADVASEVAEAAG